MEIVCFCDFSPPDLVDFSEPESADFSEPESADFSEPESAVFSEPESASFFALLSEALLASLALFADSFFDAAGLVEAALVLDGALDFAAPALLLFLLTVPLPLIVDCNPGSYTFSIPVAPQKKSCRSDFVLAAGFRRIAIRALPFMRSVTFAELRPRTAANRMLKIPNRKCKDVINLGEGKIGRPQ